MGDQVLVIEQGGRGGVTDYTDGLVRGLAGAGVRVHLATATDHGYADLPPQVQVHPVFPYLRGGTPGRDLLRRLKLHKLVNGLGYLGAVARLAPVARRAGTVHLQGFDIPPLVVGAQLLLRATGARVVHTPHNTFDRGVSFARSRRAMLGLDQRIVVHTRYDLGELPDALRERARVIPHGDYGPLAAAAPAVDRAAARAQRGLPPDAPVALCFGQLRRDKGIEDVLAAALEVPELHVLVCGQDGGALADCRALLADPRLAGRVVVREGFASLEQAAGDFAAADVSVLAYRVASMSGVLLLGYGFARPAVVYPVGGLPEAVQDGETGWLVARADVPALTDTLREVVAAGPAEAARRGEAGRELARTRYGWDAIARETAAVYRELRSTLGRR